MIGERLLHYEIVEKLGEGGMGVVYMARDMHLGRTVAIKVIRPEAVANPERKRRFVQEAKSASALNHPNIPHIYDIDQAGGIDFIAMEHVAGKTLDRLIGRKGLALRETLSYAVQITGALAKAHAAGIVHRDLKPANIMVTDDGVVKLLDFGLAKLTEPIEIDALAPTETLNPLTEEGTIVGTAAYMSPEQAEGKRVDARSDIFSFGSVLYEMVTGRRAFQGESKLGTLSAILHNEPAPFGEGVPPELEKIIARCLRKDLDRRIQHMDDLKVVLEELKQESTSGVTVHASPARKLNRGPLLAAGALVALLAGASLWSLYRREPSPAPGGVPGLTRLTSDPGLTTDPTYWPDGKLVAYASDRAGDNLDIWVQQLSGGDPHRITSHPADDHEPHFSPDGTRIAFRSARDRGGIYVMPALGGLEQKVAAQGRHPRFSPDGKWIAYWVGQPSDRMQNVNAGETYVVAASGGVPRRLAAELTTARDPVWSPDGRSLLLAGVGGKPRRFDWWLVALDSGTASPTGAVEHLAKQKLTLPVPGQWLSGRVLFTADSGDSSNLWEASLTDPFRMSGPARRLTSSSGIDVAPFSAGGRTVLASLTENADIWDLSIDADTAKITGELRRLTHDLAPDIGAVVSGDGSKVAYSSRRAGNFVLLLLDLSTGKETTLVSLPPSRVNNLLNLVPGITVDGEQVAYAFVENGAEAAAVITATGGGARTLCSPCQFRSWGNVGHRVIVSNYGPQSVTGALDIAGGEFQPLLPAGTYPFAPKTSWDDRWLTFYIPVAGKTRVWIAPIRSGSPPTESEMIPITDGSTWDSNPTFSPNGSLLYFYSQRDGSRCIWAQRLDPGSKRPVGAAFALYHLHSARRSPAYARVGQGAMSVARNRIVFVMPERLGNVWLVE